LQALNRQLSLFLLVIILGLLLLVLNLLRRQLLRLRELAFNHMVIVVDDFDTGNVEELHVEVVVRRVLLSNRGANRLLAAEPYKRPILIRLTLGEELLSGHPVGSLGGLLLELLLSLREVLMILVPPDKLIPLLLAARYVRLPRLNLFLLGS